MKRLDDLIYSTEDYYSNPKESFRFVDSLLAKHGGKKSFSLLDIGCARGEFLYYIYKQHGSAARKLAGVDISETLVEEAQKHLKCCNIDIKTGSVESLSLNEKFDYITLCGVLGYINDVQALFNNVAKHLVLGGVLVVFGFVNIYDIDVFSRYQFDEYEDFANFFSLRTIKDGAASSGLSFIESSRFGLPFSIPKDPANPRRSWTLETSEGIKFVNGLGQIFDMYGLVFKRVGSDT